MGSRLDSFTLWSVSVAGSFMLIQCSCAWIPGTRRGGRCYLHYLKNIFIEIFLETFHYGQFLRWSTFILLCWSPGRESEAYQLRIWPLYCPWANYQEAVSICNSHWSLLKFCNSSPSPHPNSLINCRSTAKSGAKNTWHGPFNIAFCWF